MRIQSYSQAGSWMCGEHGGDGDDKESENDQQMSWISKAD